MKGILSKVAYTFAFIFLGISSVNSFANTQNIEVFNGKPVPRNYAKWQAAIHLTNKKVSDGLVCGGSIIARGWILTAAHCFYDRSTKQRFPEDLLLVSYGSVALDGKRTFAHINKVHIQNYAYGLPANDIALVQTDDDLGSDFMPLAEQQDQNLELGELGVVGWGETEKSFVSNILLYATMNAYPYTNCKQFYPEIPAGVLCAGNKGTDTCHGDSGGPLYAIKNNNIVQVGITIAGDGCGVKPGLYSSVRFYLKWIDQTLQVTGSQRVPYNNVIATCDAKAVKNGIC
ncbi:S1 family peptidase [Undibacterium terreum]|uniref:Peptidase S1 domain-containing protein n=1 Tax=Undibacterium terreum TaxID=1224302 RepID=A0A916UYW7_9BURK|nr:serine protease [Undibacterium terreum]GGC93580.1 hypothetical protein GCM10011396_46110 [Undibacterium terreum]